MLGVARASVPYPLGRTGKFLSTRFHGFDRPIRASLLPHVRRACPSLLPLRPQIPPTLGATLLSVLA